MTAQADSRSDAVLLVAARAGDEQAFGVLLARHTAAAFAIAYSVVGDGDTAEDVCQDALFRVWQRLDDCREPDRFGAWMASAVRRHALNAIRGRSKEPLEGDRVPSSHLTPDVVMEREEERTRIGAALAKLPAPQREAVLLFDLADWSHARIAESLGTSEAMSRQHLMLGRRALRRLLTGKEPTR